MQNVFKLHTPRKRPISPQNYNNIALQVGRNNIELDSLIDELKQTKNKLDELRHLENILYSKINFLETENETLTEELNESNTQIEFITNVYNEAEDSNHDLIERNKKLVKENKKLSENKFYDAFEKYALKPIPPPPPESPEPETPEPETPEPETPETLEPETPEPEPEKPQSHIPNPSIIKRAKSNTVNYSNKNLEKFKKMNNNITPLKRKSKSVRFKA